MNRIFIRNNYMVYYKIPKETQFPIKIYKENKKYPEEENGTHDMNMEYPEEYMTLDDDE